MNDGPAGPVVCSGSVSSQAATGQPAVSNALLIGGSATVMMPAGVLTGLASFWASIARSPCPNSGERATEKNKSI